MRQRFIFPEELAAHSLPLRLRFGFFVHLKRRRGETQFTDVKKLKETAEQREMWMDEGKKNIRVKRRCAALNPYSSVVIPLTKGC